MILMKKTVFYSIILVFFMSSLFITFGSRKETGKKEKNKLTEVHSVKQTPAFYMRTNGQQVIIYNSDNSIYECSDLELFVLPKELIEELTEGKYFDSQEELYEFLETYTS